MRYIVTLFKIYFGNFASLYLGSYSTSVCGTLSPRIKLVELYPQKQSSTYKSYDGLENIEKRSPPLEGTLGSSTDKNLGHNHTEVLKKYVWRKFWYFRTAFSREVVGP
jgi:hypothetical protein